jgi:hypothetical protein
MTAKPEATHADALHECLAHIYNVTDGRCVPAYEASAPTHSPSSGLASNIHARAAASLVGGPKNLSLHIDNDGCGIDRPRPSPRHEDRGEPPQSSNAPRPLLRR